MPSKGGGNDRKFTPHLLRGVRGAEIHTGEKKSGCDGVKGKAERRRVGNPNCRISQWSAADSLWSFTPLLPNTLLRDCHSRIGG